MDGRTSIKKKKKTRVAMESYDFHTFWKGDRIEKRLTTINNNIKNRTIIILYCNKVRWGIEDLLLPWHTDKEGW